MSNKFFNDGLTSLITSQGDPSRDKLAAAGFNGATLSDSTIMRAYKTGWMAKRLVNAPAQDALKNWRIWQGDVNQVRAIENVEKRLSVCSKLIATYKLARAVGGAAMYIGTTDTKLDEPLKPERIGRNGLRYLTVMARSSLIAGPLETDVNSEYYGRPSYYDIAGSSQISLTRVHPSRFVILTGEPHVDVWSVSGPNRGWSESIIQASYDSLRNSNATDDNVAALVFEANINVISIPDLMKKLEDPRYEALLKERLALSAAQKGIHGDVLTDAKETFTRNSANFANLDKLMERFAIMVGASQGIPASKFLGQMPSGISSNATGELTNYYDDIKTRQSLELEPEMTILDRVIVRSALGNAPDDISYLWAPLTQPSAMEIAETGEKIANMVKNLVDSGLYERFELRAAVTNQLVNLDVLPTLGDVLAESDTSLGNDFELGVDIENDALDGPDKYNLRDTNY